MTRSCIPLAALMLSAALSPALAADDSAGERNVFAFTGRMLDENMGDSLKIFSGDYENNFITGGGYQDYLFHGARTSFGYELGGAARYGRNTTFEFWGGVVGRWNDIRLFDSLYLSPSLVFGLSYVTGIQEGREQRLEEAWDGDARLLFYLSPELEFRASPTSRYGFFYRLQHRSGAWQTLGDMEGASNANVFGIRMRF